MPTDPIHLPQLAKKKEDENWHYRSFLKGYDIEVEELDQVVFDITKRVWVNIDCTTCANCCKQMHPSLDEEEVARIAKRLNLTRQQLIEAYLAPDEGDPETPWKIRQAPCPFLKDNRCSIYEDRPAQCRGYPYLEESGFMFRLIGMIERTFVCPIVYEVMEELKREIPMRRSRH